MATNQVLGTDKALRLNHFNTLGLVNSFDWSPNFNAQDILELGRTTKVATSMELETSGTFEVGSAGMLAGLLARMIPKTDGAGNTIGFQYTPTYASGTPSGKNEYVFTQDDLTRLKFDILLHEKTEQVAYDRTTYLPCAYLTGFSGRFDANGTASDTFNWAGQFVAGFPKPYHDVVSIVATRTAAAAASLDSATATALGVSQTTHDVAFIVIDGVPYNSNPKLPNGETNNAIAGWSGATEVTVAGSDNIVFPVGSHIQVCLSKKPAQSPETDFAAINTPDRLGTGTGAVYYVKGYQTNLYIAPADPENLTSADRWLRVQSLDYSVDLRVEPLRQIAVNPQGSSVYARVPTLPFTITVNASVTEADWQEWKALLETGVTGSGKKTFAGSGPVMENVYEFSPNVLKPDFVVIAESFSRDGTKIQRMEFGDLRVDGFGSRTNVGGRGEITWTFRGTGFSVEGFEL